MTVRQNGPFLARTHQSGPETFQPRHKSTWQKIAGWKRFNCLKVWTNMFASVLILWQEIIGKQLSPEILEELYVPQIASLLSVFVNSLQENVWRDLVRIWWVFAFRDPQSLHQFICSFWVRLSKQGSSHFTCMSGFVFVFFLLKCLHFFFNSLVYSPFSLQKLLSCNCICVCRCLCLCFSFSFFFFQKSSIFTFLFAQTGVLQLYLCLSLSLSVFFFLFFLFSKV